MPATARSPLSRLTLGLGLALVLCGAPALAAAPSCPPGRFFVEDGARVLPAGEDVAIDAVVLDESGAISIASGCPPVPAKVKKRGKQLKAKWPAGACTGVPGKAKLSARFAPGCGALSGKFSAKKLKAKFTATRSDGVLLEGDPGDPALPALFDLPPQPAAPGDIVGGLILTRLDVGLIADATIGQVNAALAAVGGRIAAMRAGLPAVAVAVPRQDGPDGLRALADTLEALPGIRVALLARDAGLDEAPPPPANADAAIGYLQNARFPAAWNARAAAGACADKVQVLVADSFHRPIVLDTGFATQVPGVAELGTGSVDPFDESGFHGYDALTTLAAKLDATVPTGANPFPECLAIQALQLHRLDDLERIVAIETALLTTTGKVVINTSYGFGDACGNPGDQCTPGNLVAARAVDRAIAGAWQRRQLALDADTVLVTSTAGNNANDTVASVYRGTGLAEYNSAMNVAATADSVMSFVGDTLLWNPTSPCPSPPCLPSLTATPAELLKLEGVLADSQQTSAPPAVNVVIVGSSDNFLNNPSAFSEPGAHVQAVGEQIPTMFGGQTTQGTSFAAPQVAGLAAYLWVLSPELRALPVKDTIAAIEANASIFPAALVDAYATVLSLDPSTEVTPATAKIRLAILDLDPDGPGPALPDRAFDLTDLRAFHDAYFDSGLVLEPTAQDYSRHDLNGDGFTGGSSRTARFDLDPTGSTQFGAPALTDVTTLVLGEEQTFDERDVSDADVLCYYANTPLYTGDPAERDTLLSDLGCGSLPVFSGTVTHTFDGTDGFTTVSRTETFDVVVTLKPDGEFETTGSADLLLVNESSCEFGAERFVSIGSGPPAVVQGGGDFVLFLEARVAGTSTTSGSCGSSVVSFADLLIGTPVPSTPEFIGGRVVALAWDFEVVAENGSERATGRLERVN